VAYEYKVDEFSCSKIYDGMKIMIRAYFHEICYLLNLLFNLFSNSLLNHLLMSSTIHKMLFFGAKSILKVSHQLCNIYYLNFYLFSA